MAREAKLALISAMIDAHLADRRRSDAVCTLAMRAGARLGMDRDRLSRLAAAARVSDIGLLEIPRTLLSPLSSRARDAYAKHPERGAEILKEINGFDDVVDVVRFHHVPVQVPAPLESRILAACEAYCDAARIQGAFLARDVLRRGQQSEFSKEVVETLLAVLRSARGSEQPDRVSALETIS